MALPVYVTLTELRDTLSASAGIGARTAADGTDAQLRDALDDAHGEVLGKLATRYSLPAAGAEPVMVRSLIFAVAGYVATLEWLQGKDLSDRDPVVLRYARAQALLKGIVDGSTVVDGLEEPVAGAAVDVETFDGIPAVGLANSVLGPVYPAGPWPSYLPDGMLGNTGSWS